MEPPSPQDHGPNERDSLLPQIAEDDSQNLQHVVSVSVARRLYLSHFLSTWNSRVFEFGAVLYLATIFPGTLLPMSIYAFTRGLSAIIFASAVGWYVDTGDRLQVVRLSIGMLVLVLPDRDMLMSLSHPATCCSSFLRYLLHSRRSLAFRAGWAYKPVVTSCVLSLPRKALFDLESSICGKGLGMIS